MSICIAIQLHGQLERHSLENKLTCPRRRSMLVHACGKLNIDLANYFGERSESKLITILFYPSALSNECGNLIFLIKHIYSFYETKRLNHESPAK